MLKLGVRWEVRIRGKITRFSSGKLALFILKNRSRSPSGISLATRSPVIYRLPTSPHRVPHLPQPRHSSLLPFSPGTKTAHNPPCALHPVSSSASRVSPSSRAPTAPSVSPFASSSSAHGTSARASNTAKSTFSKPKRMERREHNGKRSFRMKFRWCRWRR